LTPEPSLQVSSPSISQFPINIECRLTETVPVGSHDLFLGEVVSVRVKEGMLGKDGAVDYTRVDPLVYLSPGYWTVSEKIGWYGISKK
jgi:flavin reductase (DIM6/NTAB) family NADH-FMN oxidoreductase RutF